MEPVITLEEVVSFLLQTPLFQDLDAEELADIVMVMQIQRLRDGQVVFREGSPGDAWFVVYNGECVVTKSSSLGPDRTLAVLPQKACFGEMAVLDGSPRSAGVTSRGDCTLFKFRRSDFQTLLEEGSLAAYKLIASMARLLCQRQRALTQQLGDLMDREDDDGADLLGQIGDMVDEYTVSE